LTETSVSSTFLLLLGPALAFTATLVSLLLASNRNIQNYSTNLLLVLSGVATVISGIMGLLAAPIAITLPIGLPGLPGLPELPIHLRLDALAGFFLVVVGLLVAFVAIYSVGYIKSLQVGRSLTPLCVFMSLFILGMQGVVLADDSYAFMICWELMSVASYFLVVYEHEKEANHKAGFLYLLMAHLGGLLILSSFSILFVNGHSFEFAAMRTAVLTPFSASMVFLLAGLGFGMKAGLMPLHVWLPEAHPVAPSNASALMSGIMIKVAIYGFLRVVFDLVGLETSAWWWGGLVLAIGSSSVVGGVLFALQQHDLKRLLAYHSVENIGIIAIGIGLSMVFMHFGHPSLAALGLVAALYHTLNHALFKGLLFMGAGAVLHATHSSNMGDMGGLIRRMPITAALFLIGCLSISALPPFNGFVSEWLTFQAALMAPSLEGTPLSALIPFSAAMLALAGALTATCFIKVFGIVFQGTPRKPAAAEAHEVDRWMLMGMGGPALLCILLGLLPVYVIPLIAMVPKILIQNGQLESLVQNGWLWLTPISSERASYSPPIVMMAFILAGIIAFLMYRRGKPVRRAALWSCGHPHLNARMQYTATSFSQPLRHIFSDIYHPEEKNTRSDHGHHLLVKRVRYSVHIRDLVWDYLYIPIWHLMEWVVNGVGWLHKQRLQGYLTYIFVTLLVLMGFLI